MTGAERSERSRVRRLMPFHNRSRVPELGYSDAQLDREFPGPIRLSVANSQIALQTLLKELAPL